MKCTWILLFLLALPLAACSDKPDRTVLESVARSVSEPVGDLSKILEVPAFDFLGSHGAPVSNETLSGKVWVASFIFTSCTTHCVTLMREMHVLEDAFGNRDDFRIVAVTVDPVHDTPKMLQSFARRNDAETDGWYFLWNEREAVRDLVEDGMKLPWDDEGVNHTLYMVLVDREGWVRGMYDASDSARMTKLRQDAAELLGS
jgi:protein SCO1/2